MKKFFDRKFNNYVVLISQGEYVTTAKPEILSTTLGSCVAICLYDLKNRVAGMNHYLLPEPVIIDDNIVFGKAKYGINAIEMMINDMLKIGAKKHDLKAKVFGGGNMFNFTYETTRIPVGKQNVDFAYKYMNLENIPVMNSDVLGNDARKIYFDTYSGEVRLFRLGNEVNKSLRSKEEQYRDKIRKLDKPDNDDSNGDITLF